MPNENPRSSSNRENRTVIKPQRRPGLSRAGHIGQKLHWTTAGSGWLPPVLTGVGAIEATGALGRHVVNKYKLQSKASRRAAYAASAIPAVPAGLVAGAAIGVGACVHGAYDLFILSPAKGAANLLGRKTPYSKLIAQAILKHLDRDAMDPIGDEYGFIVQKNLGGMYPAISRAAARMKKSLQAGQNNNDRELSEYERSRRATEEKLSKVLNATESLYINRPLSARKGNILLEYLNEGNNALNVAANLNVKAIRNGREIKPAPEDVAEYIKDFIANRIKQPRSATRS